MDETNWQPAQDQTPRACESGVAISDDRCRLQRLAIAQAPNGETVNGAPKTVSSNMRKTRNTLPPLAFRIFSAEMHSLKASRSLCREPIFNKLLGCP